MSQASVVNSLDKVLTLYPLCNPKFDNNSGQLINFVRVPTFGNDVLRYIHQFRSLGQRDM